MRVSRSHYLISPTHGMFVPHMVILGKVDTVGMVDMVVMRDKVEMVDMLDKVEIVDGMVPPVRISVSMRHIGSERSKPFHVGDC